MNAAVQSVLSDREFAQFQKLLHRLAGIHLSPAKKALVGGRLSKRLKHYRLDSYGDYFNLISSRNESGELQTALDLLTTNETQFFREPKHFDFLRNRILRHAKSGPRFRVWSAACSSGEEPYSIAMLLADQLGQSLWDIVGSDISTRVLERARNAHYDIDRAKQIPEPYLRSYCLKGIGSREGTFCIDPQLSRKVAFMQINLNEPLPRLEDFDVIFLRNVMIYFDTDTKRRVVQRLLARLKPDGHFIIGHSESLQGVCDDVVSVAPSIYRRQ